MSGEVTREFCPDCGSPMFSRSTGSPDLMFVKAGACEESDWIEPTLSCWTSRQLAWARLPVDLPGVATNP